MEPLIALVLVTLVLHAAGAAGVGRLKPWVVPLRIGLAVMFTMTGLAHFVGMRQELIDMVPPSLPAPGLLVTVTGVLELVGAAALLRARSAPWSAAALSAFLVAVFPANVYAAQQGLGSSTADSLGYRTAIQVVFLAATLTVAVHHLRARRAAQHVPTTAPAPGQLVSAS
ncbi:MAG: DoxX family membrane protein [Acidimicrobiia bacterium]|nr:DoxX family membrane protein [Acidimicrobiia bacterium]